MNPYMAVPHRKPGKYRVGDRVRILYGRPGAVGEVIEDRGNIGVKGRRLYTVRVKLDEWNDSTAEYPESSLEPVETGNGKP